MEMLDDYAISLNFFARESTPSRRMILRWPPRSVTERAMPA